MGLAREGFQSSFKTTCLLLLGIWSTHLPQVNGQFYSDYSELTGGGQQQLVGHPHEPINMGHHHLAVGDPHHSPAPSFLPSYDLPVYYKDRTFPAAYPVAPTIYSMALMKPIEAMPGKKTVPLYFVPENSLEIGPNKRFRIKKRSLRVNIKYPEWYGLTDGYHIPAVEIPLNKPMIVSQIQVNVLAPSGFMVPYSGEGDREWPYPMNTGCLVASIPSNEYVGSDHPITIRRLFAVPSLPEYPTYKPVGHNHLHIHGLEDPSHNANHAIDHLFAQVSPPKPQHHGGHRHHHVGGAGGPGGPAPPVFELVPVTQKSSRRSGKKGKKSQDDDDEDEAENVSALSSSEEDEDERPSRKKKDKKKKTTTTTTTSTTTTPTTTTSTTTPTTTTTAPTTTTTTTAATTTTTTAASTTTAAASSIQDIIAAFSTYQRLSGLDRDREADDRGRNLRGRTRLSASFRDEDSESPLRSRTKSRTNDPLKYDDDLRGERGRSRYRDYDSKPSAPNSPSEDEVRSSEEYQQNQQSSGGSGGQRTTESYSSFNSAANQQRPRESFDIERPLSQNSESISRPLTRPDRNNDRSIPSGPGLPYLPLRNEERSPNTPYNNLRAPEVNSGREVDRESSSSRRREETRALTNSEVQGLRQKMLHKQINQLQKLLTSLNLSRD